MRHRTLNSGVRFGRRRIGIVLAVLMWPLLARSEQEQREHSGFSSERLQRINDTIAKHIEARHIAGAVTLVAKNGSPVHVTAHGLMDVVPRRPMRKDGIFRLMS